KKVQIYTFLHFLANRLAYVKADLVTPPLSTFNEFTKIMGVLFFIKLPPRFIFFYTIPFNSTDSLTYYEKPRYNHLFPLFDLYTKSSSQLYLFPQPEIVYLHKHLNHEFFCFRYGHVSYYNHYLDLLM